VCVCMDSIGYMGTWVRVLDVCRMCIMSESHTSASRVYGEVPKNFTFCSAAMHQCTLAYASERKYSKRNCTKQMKCVS
jgi:hypothetical protein